MKFRFSEDFVVDSDGNACDTYPTNNTKHLVVRCALPAQNHQGGYAPHPFPTLWGGCGVPQPPRLAEVCLSPTKGVRGAQFAFGEAKPNEKRRPSHD